MLFSLKNLNPVRLFVALTATFALLLSCVLGGSAYAAESSANQDYVAADGSDLTAVAKCLPSELSEGNVGRALSESFNDYLEKVFTLKESYEDYQLDETEVEFLSCLERQGVTPQVVKAES